MRLLHRTPGGSITLSNDIVCNIPRYAILSHVWGKDEDEVTLADIRDDPPRARSKVGYEKIKFCGEQAARDGLQYFWVDTCCIDKTNSAELAEAVNSMFRWYRDAAVCYVYLADVQRSDNISLAFSFSRYFTRGWTLQELIAPRSVEFFTCDAHRLGNKQTLEQKIASITGIPPAALRGNPLKCFTVDERMAWAANRKTTKEEDRAYCLLGIFNVFMVPIYGEFAEERDKRRDGPLLRSNPISYRKQPMVRSVLESFLDDSVARSVQFRMLCGQITGTTFDDSVEQLFEIYKLVVKIDT